MKLIKQNDVLQAHPEFLNEQIDDHDKAIYAKGWNDCNKEYYNAITELPVASMACTDLSTRLRRAFEADELVNQRLLLDAADAIEELLRWRGHSFLRWEKENYKTPPTEVFHDRYYDAMQVVHAICNANPPEGVSPETFRECLAAVFREIEELPTIKFPPKEAADDA